MSKHLYGLLPVVVERPLARLAPRHDCNLDPANNTPDPWWWRI